MRTWRLVTLISGRGSNLRALHEAARHAHWSAAFVGVVSDRADAAGLTWARGEGIETRVVETPDRAARNAGIEAAVAALEPDLVLLAGYMRLLPASFVQRFRGRILNIHPSLLPAFPGLHTHRRAIEAGCRFAGATVHVVTEELDVGPIVDQAVVPVLASDDEATLAARVLAAEHQLYPRAVARWISVNTPGVPPLATVAQATP